MFPHRSRMMVNSVDLTRDRDVWRGETIILTLILSQFGLGLSMTAAVGGVGVDVTQTPVQRPNVGNHVLGIIIQNSRISNTAPASSLYCSISLCSSFLCRVSLILSSCSCIASSSLLLLYSSLRSSLLHLQAAKLTELQELI